MEKKKLLVIIVVMVIVAVATFSLLYYLENKKEQEEKQEPTGPTLIITPRDRGVWVSKGYALAGVFGEADIDIELPENYSLPAEVKIYNITNIDYYRVIIGNSSLPATYERTIPLSEEIKITDLQEGVTRIILVL